MRRRKWPDGADKQRRQAVSAFQAINDLAEQARALTKKDPILVELLLADIQRYSADGRSLLLLAKLGESEQDYT